MTKRAVLSGFVWFLSGLVVGWGLAPGGGLDAVYDAYDQLFPIVEAKAEIMDRTVDSVYLHVFGEKKRACEFLAANAYSRFGAAAADVNLERIDRPASKMTRPLGPFDSGIWRVWPIPGSSVVELAWTYNCAGRVVVEVIARVAVGKP